MKPIDEVIGEYAPQWLEIDGVEGVFEGVDARGVDVIRVAVAKRTRSLLERLPAEAGGYPVEVVETGPIVPL